MIASSLIKKISLTTYWLQEHLDQMQFGAKQTTKAFGFPEEL